MAGSWLDGAHLAPPRALDLPGQLLDRARRLGSTLSGHGDRRGLRVDPEPPCRPRSKFCAPRPNDRRPARLKMGPPRSPARSPMAERNDAAYRRYIDQLSDLARSALPLYGVDTRADIGLLSHSENTVFRIEDRRAGFKAAMRIHRPNSDAQRHPDRAGLDARAERGRHRHATSLARAGRHGAARHARAGGHALCSVVPLDRRRFSRSGQAGRLAAPPGLAQRPHARAVAPGGVPAISSAWSGTTPARWARPRIGDSGNARRA